MDPFVSTLTGVVVGAASTWGVEIARRRHVERREFRTAARTTELVLSRCLYVADGGDDAPTLGARQRVFAAIDHAEIWVKHVAVLAARLDDDEWRAFELGWRAVPLIEQLSPGPGLAAAKAGIREQVGPALRILGRYTGMPADSSA
ncbi:MAG TPA: hypothetical protein VFU94_12565 [Conexibacter sp.]|nr:hypothetical protein [Conexibacter sp.]